TQQVAVEVALEFDVLSDVGGHRRIDVLSEPHAQLCRRERKGPGRHDALRVRRFRSAATQRVQSPTSLSPSRNPHRRQLAQRTTFSVYLLTRWESLRRGRAVGLSAGP